MDNNQKSHPVRNAFAVIGVIALVTVFSLFALAAWVASSLFSFSGSLSSLSNTTPVLLRPHISPFATKMSFSSSSYIAVIRFVGEIDDDFASDMIEKLEYARQDKAAKAILLEVNCPGGSVGASQEIYDYIKYVKETKPVVAYVRELAASGAYYSIAPTSHIVANRGSWIGSIGVIMHSFEVEKLMEFLKINPVTLKTGALKDTGTPFRPLSADEKTYLQDLQKETLALFIEDIKAARPIIDANSIKYMSDARVVLAPTALRLKLIDSLGSRNDALKILATLAEIPEDTPLYIYEDQENLHDLLFGQLSEFSSQVLVKTLGKIMGQQSSSEAMRIEAK